MPVKSSVLNCFWLHVTGEDIKKIAIVLHTRRRHFTVNYDKNICLSNSSFKNTVSTCILQIWRIFLIMFLKNVQSLVVPKIMKKI